jgi:hypothetical protein
VPNLDNLDDPYIAPLGFAAEKLKNHKKAGIGKPEIDKQS